jgi:hypothetical protein
MSFRLTTVFCFLVTILLPWSFDRSVQAATSTCVQCHAAKQDGFGPAHAFGANNCIVCHAGDNQADAPEDAHSALLAFPGELDNAMVACGNCHADRVSSVSENLMHKGSGIVHVTRQVLDEAVAPERATDLQSLGHSVADSMLRKQCASCHIGQTKTEHKHNVMQDRGGGCLACHIDDYPEDAHPALTARVSDARCFGCHARSGRISLSYTGLAEIDFLQEPGTKPGMRLPDGRHVERMPADIHYQAGMSCIDCHTSVGLMGGAGDALHQRQAVDISCTDCHDNQGQTIGLSAWPASLTSIRNQLPFTANEETAFLTTEKNGTPLWHVELRNDGLWLHTKNTGKVLQIPLPDPARHKQDEDHQRLMCATCHSQWAPQCFGCHMSYDADGEQWDHVERAVTAGRWSNERWQVHNTLAALGVNEDNRIELFVPGMIMTVAHPAWEQEKFIRMFAPLSPHTTGNSRSCQSCHRSSEALGLGQGDIIGKAGEEVFEPANEHLRDGLPADAWTNIGNSLGGRTPAAGQRPLNKAEMELIRNAPLPE